MDSYRKNINGGIWYVVYKLDEVKESITRVLKDMEYDKYIEDTVRKAKVVINQSIYKKLKIE